MGLWNRPMQEGESSRTETPEREERRARDRKRQRLIDGFISQHRLPKPRPCTICNMTSNGSKVELWSTDGAPVFVGERVTLYIAADRQEVEGEVVWRKEAAMGLRFTSEFRAPTRPYS